MRDGFPRRGSDDLENLLRRRPIPRHIRSMRERELERQLPRPYEERVGYLLGAIKRNRRGYGGFAPRPPPRIGYGGFDTLAWSETRTPRPARGHQER